VKPVHESDPTEAPPPELAAVLADASAVVFLCSGNMVRSAFAELLARELGLALPVRSAATTYRNDSLFPETAAALLERGVGEQRVFAFRPTHIDDCLHELDDGALVLGMTRDHLEAVSPRPSLRGRAFLLRAVLGDPGEIDDPVLGGAAFGPTFALVERCVRRLVELVDERGASD